MKLVTRKGALDLPQDFSITMERTNPLLSDQGDASIPASLPSSPRNLAVLGHRERIDRAEKYINKVDALLQVGPVQKKGQLVIDNISRRGGIDTSLAIDSSDLYVTGKDKSLKTLVGDKKETFEDIQEAADILTNIFNSGDPQNEYDFTVFPVAVSPYEDTDPLTGEKSTVYQLNNEIFFSGGIGKLVWEAREVHEGDIMMSVPDGYGLAPFLKLYRLIDILFEQMGYTIVENCFDDTDAVTPVMSNLVMVHNCADALCTGVLMYRDMVPSCTLSEFLSWLLAKFHVQPVVDSETKTARIVAMENMLAGDADADWTGKVEGDWRVMLQPQKRVVLCPKGQSSDEAEAEETDEEDTSLEVLTKPAARTLNGLVDKYGGYVELNEARWDTLEGITPAATECLVLRKTTGIFYKLYHTFEPVETDIILLPEHVRLTISRQKAVNIGTNHFVYDRYNSDEKEEYQQDDLIPLMLIDLYKPGSGGKDVVPYIGERIHYNTAYEGRKEDDKQEIILCQKAFNDDNNGFFYRTTGTTQAYVPFSGTVSGANGVSLPMSLTNYSMYGPLWALYNTLLLNNSPHVEGRLKLAVGDFLNSNLGTPKMVSGQKLMPVKMSAELGDRIGMTEMEALIVKQWANQITDSPINPTPAAGLSGMVWRVTNDAASKAAEIMEDMRPSGEYWELLDYLVLYGDEAIDLGIPLAEGETHIVERQFEMQLKVFIRGGAREYTYWIHKDGLYDENNSQLVTQYDFSQYLEAVTITSTFTSRDLST